MVKQEEILSVDSFHSSYKIQVNDDNFGSKTEKNKKDEFCNLVIIFPYLFGDNYVLLVPTRCNERQLSTSFVQ